MEYSNKETFDALKKGNEKMLVCFSADWCGPCKALTPILEEVEKEQDAKVIKINVDAEGELAQIYGVRGIPTMLVMVGEDVKHSLVGNQPKSEIILKLGDL